MKSLKTLNENGRVTAAVAVPDQRRRRRPPHRLRGCGAGPRPHAPGAQLHHLSVRATDPIWMLTAPIPATERALQKAGMRIDDIDVVEINEAFASVRPGLAEGDGADPAKVNPNGGAIALGHPLGATGARLMTTLLNELERTGGRYGLQTMCEGGGQANVTIIERL